MNKRKRDYFVVVLILLSTIIGASLFVNQKNSIESQILDTEIIFSNSFYPSEEKGITVRLVPEDVEVISGQGALPSSITELTTSQVIQESDLVAFITVTSLGTSFSKFPAHPITIYNASIDHIIKGPMIADEIHIVAYEGFINDDQFMRTESEPVFKVGDKWLLFMNTKNYVKELDLYLLKNSYRPRPITNVQVIDDKLSLLNKDIPTKLDLDGLEVNDFILRYGS
jgi:hypothetical protein